MNEWIQMEVGRRRIIRAAPDRKASQSAHSASFFPFLSPLSLPSFPDLLPSPLPPSSKGCSSLLVSWRAGRINEKEQNLERNSFQYT